MHLRPIPLFLAALGLLAPWASGIELPAMFSRHAVLQQEETVPVWGWGTPGEAVSVTFAGQSKRTMADEEGNWRIELAPLKASAEGQILEVTGEESGRLEVEDILVGEV